ncbi:nitroreductase [Asanoa sp. WMMD1127]|uniref:Acg family FMN-binding oxidoreductase n=1 Tax=Asanoa sp. WMMD1127 TaxID=3016107 RepID=UPI002416C2A4|nr:nitroreductase [Asanoa sp. WMMD1127]MDG4825338.1 nitroreductase [Asanoa sp. WMMD1127]
MSNPPLAEAAEAAVHAPSIHNTRPWRWEVRADRLALHAERGRQLAATDPDGRMLDLSCGAALQHARLALLARGWETEVRYQSDPDLLAELVPTARVEPAAPAMRLVRAMPARHTDRRPLADVPLPAGTIDALRAAAAGLARFHLLTADQVLLLASAAHHAAEIEAEDPRIRAELAYWTSRSDGTGLSPAALPARPPRTTVPARDFGRPGTLPVGDGHDKHARFALLYGDDDERASWLRAGAALTNVWLTAVGLGVSLVPLSGAIEVSATRERLRGILAGLGHPYLVLRLGVPDPATA